MPWHTLTLDGRTRKYFYKTQSHHSTSTPLVIALHGGGGSATGFNNSADWIGASALFDVRVVIAEGVERPTGGCTWNVGDGEGYAEQIGVDDIKYIDQVISQVGATGHVYLVGMSKGGMLAYKYAHEGNTVITGIGVVSGVLVDQSDSILDCVKVVHLHGDADTNVPLFGGNGRGPVEDGFLEAIDDNGPMTKSTVYVSDGKIDTYLDTGGNTMGIFYTITGGPHNWDVSPSQVERDFILGNLL